MASKTKTSGFSLVELLFVLAIIGIISAIAIPSFLGQRRRARVIGDAQANSQVLRMQLETAKADTGIYGAAGQYNWTPGTGPDAPMAALLPSFMPNGAAPPYGTQSTLSYNLTVANAGLTYLITVTDPNLNNLLTYKIDQAGNVLFVLQ